MSRSSSRHERGGEERQGGNFPARESWLSLSDLAVMLERPTSTIGEWYHGGRLPSPDAPHRRSPLWKRATIERWLEEDSKKCDQPVACWGTEGLEYSTREASDGEMTHRMDGQIGTVKVQFVDTTAYPVVTQSELGACLGYKHPSSIGQALDRGDIVADLMSSTGVPMFTRARAQLIVAFNPLYRRRYMETRKAIEQGTIDGSKVPDLGLRFTEE